MTPLAVCPGGIGRSYRPKARSTVYSDGCASSLSAQRRESWSKTLELQGVPPCAVVVLLGASVLLAALPAGNAAGAEIAKAAPRPAAAELASGSTGFQSEKRKEPAHDSGPYLVRAIELEGLSGKGLTWEELQFVPVKLSEVNGGYAAPRSGCPTEEFWLLEIAGLEESGRYLYGSALQAIAQAISKAYLKRRLAAVRVSITEADLNHLTEPGSDGVLTIHITEGVISELRSVVSRDGKKYEGNAPIYRKILQESPLNKGSLLDLNRLDSYVYRLNRHPGRHVDVAVAPGSRPGELALDFIVRERRPYLVYSQVSNTGTEETSTLRERFGFAHYNLTGFDDIFSLDYVTGDFDRVHALTASYERPLEGIRELWARVYGSYSRFDASEVGILELDYQGETFSGGCELGWNLFQEAAFFVDLVGGVSYFNATSENLLIWDGKGEGDFLVPYVSVRAEQRTRTRNFSASLTMEDCPSVTGTTRSEAEELGRTGAHEKWSRLRWRAVWSAFLEELLSGEAAGEGKVSTLAHELAVSVRGQYTFDTRVPPIFLQTAGGFYSVRGYPEAFASGDLGALGSLEYRLHAPKLLAPAEPLHVLGTEFRAAPERPLGATDWDLVLRSFLDISYTRHHHRLRYERNLLLLGAGVGVELWVLRNLQLRLDWGFPLKEAFNGEEETRVGMTRLHFSVAAFW